MTAKLVTLGVTYVASTLTPAGGALLFLLVILLVVGLLSLADYLNRNNVTW